MSSLFEKIGAEVKRGLVQIAALSLLRRRLYGYQLVKILAAHGLETEEGTLYPLLRRLETQGLLTSEWDTNGARPRKYYVLSGMGLAALPRLQTAWHDVAGAVSSILDGDAPGEAPVAADLEDER